MVNSYNGVLRVHTANANSGPCRIYTGILNYPDLIVQKDVIKDLLY